MNGSRDELMESQARTISDQDAAGSSRWLVRVIVRWLFMASAVAAGVAVGAWVL